jgi:hypothetical protein
MRAFSSSNSQRWIGRLRSPSYRRSRRPAGSEAWTASSLWYTLRRSQQ